MYILAIFINLQYFSVYYYFKWPFKNYLAILI